MALPDYPMPQLEVTLQEASRVLQVCLTPEQYQEYTGVLHQEEKALWDAHHHMVAMATGCQNWATAQFKTHILSCRDPLHASTAIPVLLPMTGGDLGENGQVERAAALLWAAAKLHSEPWQVEGDELMERTQQSEVFASSRLPGKAEDHIEVYPESLHAILLCAGGIFPIQILCQDNPGGALSPLPVHDIYIQLAEAMSQAATGKDQDPAPLCHFSSLPRQHWYALREQILAAGGAVAASLRLMERAVLAIALEDCRAPLNLAETLNIVRLGRREGRCLRYYDKVVNIVVFQDGEAGIVFEHSALDGMVAGLVTNGLWHVSESLSLDFNQQLPGTTPNHRNVQLLPKSLDVDMTCLSLSSAIPPPKDTNVIMSFETLSYPDFLKTLRSQRGLFDAWVNFSLQLALRKTVGDLAKSYIFVAPSHMRHYKHGRCDPTYPVTTQSISLVEALTSCASMTSTPLYTKVIFHLFHLAFQEHKHLIKSTKKGQSIGPHLAALRKALPSENALRKFLDFFNSPPVYITGKDTVDGMAFAVGNVYAQDQLAVTYLGRMDRVSLALNGKGSFGTILGQLQENFQESLELVMLLALRYVIAGQMGALDCFLQSIESEGMDELVKGEMDMQFSYQDLNKATLEVIPPIIALKKDSDFTVIIHGGIMEEVQLDEKIFDIIEFSLQAALAIAAQEFSRGGSSLSAVRKCMLSLEDCLFFNAGRGSAFNKEGEPEMEATIVDGTGMKSGSVACVRSVKNPIAAAWKVMENSANALFVGDKVEEFLEELGERGECIGVEYFHTNVWRDFTAKGKSDNATGEAYPQAVGAVALDQWGNLAAATSTGGTVGKRKGHIGEAAVVGAGTFADKTIAVTCCGNGELLLRLTAAHKVVSLYHHMGYGLKEACQEVLSGDLKGSYAGIIAIDAKGEIVIESNGGMMFVASKSGGREYTMVLKPTVRC